MRIFVFLKTIPDPEAPADAYRFQGREVEAARAAWVLGPFESNALELAVQISEKLGGELTALALGGKEQEVGLRRALAVGAVRAVRIDIETGEGWRSPLATARALARAASTLGGADYYVFGRQAGDWDQGVMAGLFAGLTNLPFVPLVRAVDVRAGELQLVRELPDGWEEGVLAAPAVLSATNGPGTLLRIAKVRDVMQANRKPIEVLSLPEEPAESLRLQAVAPHEARRSGRVVSGTVAEVAEALLTELRRLGLVGGMTT